MINLDKNHSLRFAVRSESDTNLSSSVWIAWRKNDDVFIANKGTAGAVKVSLHKSGLFRFALTAELASHKPPITNGDRVLSRWSLPDFRGLLHVQVFSLRFTVVENWHKENLAPGKPVVLLGNAPKGYFSEVAVFYSWSDPLAWHHTVWPTKNIVASCELSNGSFVTFRKRVAPLPSGKISDLVEQYERGSIICVGERNPEFSTAGIGTAHLTETTQNHCTIYSVSDLTMPLGLRATWSTRTGNHFANNMQHSKAAAAPYSPITNRR